LNHENRKQIKRYSMAKRYKGHRYEDLCGVKWYYYLVPNENFVALLDTLRSPEEHFIVCATLPDEDPKKPIRLFAAFDDLLTFVNHIKRIPVENWYYFEVIMGERPQKLYFDIDIKAEDVSGDMDLFTQGLLETLVERVVRVFSEYGHKLDLSKNIILFSSNSKEKHSYHLIVDGYSVSDNIENRALAEEVLDGISNGYRDCVDPGVYSKKQQLRLYLSQKPHSNRPKRLVERWKYGSTMIESALAAGSAKAETDIPEDLRESLRMSKIFLASAITYVERSIRIPVLFDEPAPKRTRVQEDDLEVTPEMIQEIIQKTDQALFQIYKIDRVIGPLIILKRLRPAHCSLCNRTHESENAFLRVSVTGRVYFYCRRNAERNKYTTSVRVEDELREEHALSTVLKFVQNIAPTAGSVPSGPIIYSRYAQVRALAAGKQ